MSKDSIKNETLKKYAFLDEMINDKYYPNHLVEEGQQILIKLCLDIEKSEPKNLEDLYKLTHAATSQFNDLEEKFIENDSEIETVARECIGENFYDIAIAYGFKDVDREDIIATREW
jgi:hypothetical protein